MAYTEVTLAEVKAHLERCIDERWRPISRGKPVKIGAADLCEIADKIGNNSGKCDGCPIYELNHDKYLRCANTAISRWDEAKKANDDLMQMMIAVEEVKFLQKVINFYFAPGGEQRISDLIQKRNARKD